jgi:DNA-binding CsgD family transcriptional regulator
MVVAGTHGHTARRSPANLAFPAAELPSWTECLLPAGFHQALPVTLFAPGGRRVGLLARPFDPLRSLATVAGLVNGARAGVGLHENGGIEVLPGLSDHELLAADSPALAAARTALDAGRPYSSFLWPLGGRHAPEGHARITVLAGCEDLPASLTGAVVVSPPGELQDLTPRELEVLGLLIEGCTNAQVAAELFVAQRTVAAHVEHVLAKLAAPSRTLAAVRAGRAGLYVPRQAVRAR